MGHTATMDRHLEQDRVAVEAGPTTTRGSAGTAAMTS